MTTEHLDKIAAVARKQFGVIAAWQAPDSGLSRDQFDRLVAAGSVERISRGIYRLKGTTDTWEQQTWIACLEARGVVSHRSAAWLWELDGVNRARPKRLELVVPMDRRPRPRTRGVTLRRSRTFTNQHRRLVKGVPATTLARTVFDLSQILSAKALEIAVASALRQEPKLYEQLESLLAPLPPHAAAKLARLKPMLVTKDQAVDSAFEVMLRRFLRQQKIREPEPQHTVFDGNAFIAQVDFAWPRNDPPVVLQAHGERYHGNTAQWRRDLQQASELNEIGWRVIQCSMSDLKLRPRRLAQMIRRALAGYRSDGKYRDEHLREPDNDSFPGRLPKR